MDGRELRRKEIELIHNTRSRCFKCQKIWKQKYMDLKIIRNRATCQKTGFPLVIKTRVLVCEKGVKYGCN